MTCIYSLRIALSSCSFNGLSLDHLLRSSPFSAALPRHPLHPVPLQVPNSCFSARIDLKLEDLRPYSRHDGCAKWSEGVRQFMYVFRNRLVCLDHWADLHALPNTYHGAHGLVWSIPFIEFVALKHSLSLSFERRLQSKRFSSPPASTPCAKNLHIRCFLGVARAAPYVGQGSPRARLLR